MNVYLMLTALAAAIAGSASPAFAQDAVKPAPPEGTATTVYRQVTPDGRVVYSDKALKGAKIDHTIKVEPAIKGNLWTAEAGPKPVAAHQVETTPIKRINTPAGSARKKTLDEATSDVIRAEMLLEDAKKRQQAGVEPLQGERTGNASGGSRLNETYQARQQALAKDVSDAEASLRKAQSDRDQVRPAR
jgi:hypothetical protein